MGEENYKLRKKRQEFEAEAPMYNKDTFPTEKGIKKDQFDKNKSGWNDRFGISENMLSGAYINALGNRKVITFKLNEVNLLEQKNNDLYKLNFNGLGNLYNNYGQLNETFVTVTKKYEFYTDGEKVFALEMKNISENKEKNDLIIEENEYSKIKHLMGYDPNKFRNTKLNKKVTEVFKMKK